MICIAAEVLQNTMNTFLSRTETIECEECFLDRHFNLQLGARSIIEMSSFCHFFFFWTSFSQDGGHQVLASAFHSIISSKKSQRKSHGRDKRKKKESIKRIYSKC